MFVLALVRTENDAHRQKIVHLVERNVLILHLAEDGIRRLHTIGDGVIVFVRIEDLSYWFDELLVRFLQPRCNCRHLFLNFFVDLRLFVFETEVFEFGFYQEETQTSGKWRIYILCLAADFVLFGWRHRTERAHVVQTVRHFYQNHAHIFGHGQNQSTEIFGLFRCFFAKNAARNFCQSRYDLGDFRTKALLDVLHSVVGIFHHIVQQCRAD